MTTEFCIGFFTGAIITAMYTLWFIYQLKKQGYIKPTGKLNDLKEKRK